MILFYFLFSNYKKAKMPLLHRIDNIDGRLLNIELIQDPGYFTIHIKLGRDTYEFKFVDNTIPLCCEEVGFYTYLGNDVDTENKTENNIMDFIDIIGDNITTIKFEEKQVDTCGTIFIKFLNGEENIVFTLEFYNWHNGYYPHDLIVNLNEGDSYEGMQIFYTCI